MFMLWDLTFLCLILSETHYGTFAFRGVLCGHFTFFVFSNGHTYIPLACSFGGMGVVPE